MPAGLVAKDANLASRGLAHPGNGFEQCALAGPIRADHGHPLTGLDLQINIMDGCKMIVLNFQASQPYGAGLACMFKWE
jgi:hypothetical protein